MYGSETTSGGSTTTVISTSGSASGSFSNGKAAFRWGQTVPPTAPGGHVRLSNGATGVLVVGAIIADFVNYLVGEQAPKPLPLDAKIADTCSCYQKPVTSDQ
jgi:hypothetical protein